MQKQEPPGEVPAISVSDSQGVFAGSGNQYNNWTPKPPLDPAALGALNPHVAVARLQQVPHDELVDFFARASPGDASEIIETMSHVDVEKLTTVLADINRRKATELIEGSPLDPRLFGSLPEASEAISRKAATWRWTQAGSVQVWANGYSRSYDHGNIFWRSTDRGTWTVKGAIARYVEHLRIGTERNILGFPTGDEKQAPKSNSGTEGIRQTFENGTVYSSRHGTFAVPCASCYETERSSGGWLGFPIGDMQENGTLGLLQKFEGGVIYYYGDAEKKSFSVVREIVKILPGNRKSRPISAEDLVKRSSGKGQTAQRFEIEGKSGIFEAVVYWDEVNEPVMVASEVWKYYSDLGAEKSWLGFPLERVRPFFPQGTGGSQEFENGTIYWQPESRPIGIPAAVIKLLVEHAKNFREPLGFPVTEEQPSGEDGSGRIQYFEQGVVTYRDGKYEIWVRPESPTGPPAEGRR